MTSRSQFSNSLCWAEPIVIANRIDSESRLIGYDRKSLNRAM